MQRAPLQQQQRQQDDVADGLRAPCWGCRSSTVAPEEPQLEIEAPQASAAAAWRLVSRKCIEYKDAMSSVSV